MFSKIHDQLGTAGLVVGIVALIAALAGTAFAAVDRLSRQEKVEVKKIAKKFAGPAGPAGSQGPAGAEGKQGLEGKQGAAGEDGEDGACSVANPSCVLPPGATSTGHWSFANKGLSAFVSISFPLRVIPAPGVFEVAQNWIGPGDSPTPQCPGTAKDPKAAPGEVCMYVGSFSGSPAIGSAGDPVKTDEWTQDRTSGLIAEFEFSGEEAYGAGTWAVTAAE